MPTQNAEGPEAQDTRDLTASEHDELTALAEAIDTLEAAYRAASEDKKRAVKRVSELHQRLTDIRQRRTDLVALLKGTGVRNNHISVAAGVSRQRVSAITPTSPD